MLYCSFHNNLSNKQDYSTVLMLAVLIVLQCCHVRKMLRLVMSKIVQLRLSSVGEQLHSSWKLEFEIDSVQYCLHWEVFICVQPVAVSISLQIWHPCVGEMRRWNEEMPDQHPDTSPAPSTGFTSSDSDVNKRDFSEGVAVGLKDGSAENHDTWVVGKVKE